MDRDERGLDPNQEVTGDANERPVEMYDVAPENMPPSPAGADVEIGGEAAASRRFAGTPEELRNDPERTVGEATPGVEPFLGYDGLQTDDLIGWIEEADPETDQLRTMFDYEGSHRAREAVLHELKERLRRSGLRPPQAPRED